MITLILIFISCFISGLVCGFVLACVMLGSILEQPENHHSD